jgi:biotin carboxyl carrier protein
MTDKPPPRPPPRPSSGAPRADRGHGAGTADPTAARPSPAARPARPAAAPPPSPDAEAAVETRVRPAQGGAAELVVVGGAFVGARVALGAGTVVIGRSSECDLVLRTGSGVSRRHCKVQFLADRYVVIDLESRNGTIVNGQSVERKVLEAGDRIEVGDEVIEFRRVATRPAEISGLQPAPPTTGSYPRPPLPTSGDDEVAAPADLPPTLPPTAATAIFGAQTRGAPPARPFAAVPDVPSLLPRPSSTGGGPTIANAPSAPVPSPSAASTSASRAPWAVGAVVVVSLAVIAFLAWDIAQAPTTLVAAPAAGGVVDAGSAAPVVVADAGGAGTVASVDAGGAAPGVVVDAGVAGGVAADAGAAVVDAGVPAAGDAGAPGVVVAGAGDAGGAATVAPPVVVRARGAGQVARVLVAPGDRVAAGAGVVVIEVEVGGRKLAALRREEAEFAAAAATRPSVQADLDAVRAEIRRLSVRQALTLQSDRAGTVVDVLVRPGDMVRDGLPVLRVQP